MRPSTVRSVGFLLHDRWYPVLPVLAAIVAFSGTLGHQLVMEDQSILDYVRTIVSDQGVLSLLSAEFRLSLVGGSMGYYRPIVLFSLWLDSHLVAVCPYAFHFTNIVLHGAVTWILYFVLLEMLGSRFGATAGAFLFAVHPIHVESVAFVSGRTDLWAAFFVLAHAYLWLQERRGAPGPVWSRRGIAFGCYILGSLSKETALLAPAVLILFDGLCVRHPEGHVKGWWQRNRAWFVLWSTGLLAVVLLRLLVVRVGFGGEQGPEMQTAISTGGWGMIPLKLAFYLKLLVLPWPLNPFWEADRLDWGWVVVACSLVFVVLCLLGAGKRQRHVGVFAIVWTVAFLLPALGLVPIQGAVVAERFLYLPSVGLALAVGSLLATKETLRPPSKVSLLAVCLALTGVFFLGTITRARAWTDEVTLFSKMVETFPESPFGWYFLGGAKNRLGHHQDAVDAAKKAIRFKPDLDLAYFSLGYSYSKLGSFKESVAAYREAARLRPDSITFYNLGYAYDKLDSVEEAAASYREAIRLRPGFRQAYLDLGAVYARHGNLRKATDIYREATHTIPNFFESYYFLGVCYNDLGLTQEAIAAFREAVRLKRDHTASYVRLGATYGSAGMFNEAISSFESAIRLDPELEEARRALGDLFLEVGDPERAIDSYLKALHIQSDNILAAQGLGQAYVQAGKIPEAVAVLEEVLRRWPNDIVATGLLSEIAPLKKVAK